MFCWFLFSNSLSRLARTAEENTMSQEVLSIKSDPLKVVAKSCWEIQRWESYWRVWLGYHAGGNPQEGFKIITGCFYHPYIRITMYKADEFGYRVKNKIIYLNEIEKQPEKEEILIIGPIPPFLRNNSNR